MTKEEEKVNNALLTLAHRDFSKGLGLHAFYKINNKELSSDLVQETFMKTFQYLLKGGKIVLMRAFLYHVLNNLIIDEYRKKKNSSLDELLEKGYEPAVNGQDRFIDFLDGQRAMELISVLPKNYRECMHMKYVQDLSLEEMSVLTGKTKNSLAVILHRGLEKLKALYTKEK